MGPRGSVWAHIESIQRQNRIRKRLQPLPTPKTPLKNSKIKKIIQTHEKIQFIFFPYFSGWGYIPISLFGVFRWGHSYTSKFPFNRTSGLY